MDGHLPDSSVKGEKGEWLNYLICLRNAWIGFHEVFGCLFKKKKKEKKEASI